MREKIENAALAFAVVVGFPTVMAYALAHLL